MTQISPERGRRLELQWDGPNRKYHNHKRLKETLTGLATEFPDITELYSIGKSVQVSRGSWDPLHGLQGRDLLVLRIAEGITNPRPLLRPQVSIC